MRTVLVKDLEPGMIIRCGFIVLTNTTNEKYISVRRIEFLTSDCKILISNPGDTWDYEIFQ